ncbi:MAG: ABC-type amino acid transport/signal transduction systems periplasmic component/domain-like [Bacteroidetes bacterium]|nr:MAG: ABC-type amino acid transport/signal transduction systems periplasmic component/domain-like [Bacteroidota bacterium]
MKTKLILITASLLMLAAFFTINSCKKDEPNDKTIQISGVEFKPNFFTNDGVVVGIDADIAAQALQNTGIEYTMSMSDSWQEAYDATVTGPNKALLTTAFTAERKDLFKWAGPTSQGMYGIVEKGNSGYVFPLPIEECKLLPSIAVVRNWMETITLEELGFTNLVYFDTYDEALAALMNDEIRFLASDFYHLTSVLPPGYYMTYLRSITRYRTVYYYIAFSKDVEDAVVSNVQNAIETMIKDKSTVAIVNNYIPAMPSDYMAGTMQLFTEVSPPNNFGTGQGAERKVEGSAVDIVNEIQTRTGYVNKINLSLWNDAYAIAQYLPNSAVFTTARTPERENLFQWVGPVSSSRSHFYTLASSGLNIETLEQAKALQSIATPNGWFTHNFLINNNFSNIVATAITSQDAFNQLITGEVQALLLTDVGVKWLADINGIPMSDITQQMEALDFKGYIAFSLSTPATTVQQWQNHLNNMKADGTFETIWNKWFEGVPMP